jgi:UPF0755 protein
MNPGRAFFIAASVAVLLIGGGGFAGYSYYHGQVNDPRRVGQGPAVVDVPAGAGVSGVGDILARQGVIGSTVVFEIYVRTHGLANRLEAGHYSIPGGSSMAGALALLTHAVGTQVKVTIPEGFTEKQVAALFEKNGLGSAAAFQQAANSGLYSQAFLAGRAPGYGLEGYLFPDTYFFDPKVKPAAAITVLLDNFGAKVPSDLRAHAADQHLTFSQAVVLASIIEGEAAFDKDRPYIAAVFYNRLAQGLPLQADSTLAYIKGQRPTVITEQDKVLNSLFNTYLHTGLPPAPISNPGLASIRAALVPASGFTYLYFLTDSSGHAHFSRTLDQHNQCQLNLGACPTAP